MDNVLKFAEKGEAWAEVMMGDIYMGREKLCGNQKVNKAKAKKWYRLASEQDFAEAIYKYLYFCEEEENPTQYRQQLKMAAEMGCSQAARTLAIKYWADGRRNVDKVEYYASIALGSISNAKKDEYLSSLLGVTMCMKSDALSSEWTYKYRAKYYLEIGAKKNFVLPIELPNVRSMICIMYADNMLQLGAREYCGYMVSINAR